MTGVAAIRTEVRARFSRARTEPPPTEEPTIVAVSPSAASAGSNPSD